MDTRILTIIPVKPNLNHVLKAKCMQAADAMQDANPDMQFMFDTTPIPKLPTDYTPWSRVTRIRNLILTKINLEEWTHLLWIDADVIQYPTDLAAQLLQSNPTGVSAPMIFVEKLGNHFYDWAAFIIKGKDGIQPFNPKQIFGRNLSHSSPFWPTEPTTRITEMDCVGTITLVPTIIYADGTRYLDHPSMTDHYPICRAARDRGLKVTVNRDIHAVHANLPLYGEAWH